MRKTPPAASSLGAKPVQNQGVWIFAPFLAVQYTQVGRLDKEQLGRAEGLVRE